VKQYELWWAELPAPVGVRPVLLLSRSAAYAYLTRVIVVEVTTRIRGIPQEIPLGPREGVPRASVARLDNLATIPVGLLRRRLGRLRPARHPEVKRALGYTLEWPELVTLAGT
jgi:mRNA interferase MazF